MDIKLNLNNVLTTVVIGLLTWMGTTLQSLDKKMGVIEYKVDEMKEQSHYEDCPICNHHKHEQIPLWLKAVKQDD